MNRKAKGTRREHQTIKWLEAQGYACTRAAASLGAWDIVAVGWNDAVLVQVKANVPVSKKEMERLKCFPMPCEHFRKMVCVWYDREVEPHVNYL